MTAVKIVFLSFFTAVLAVAGTLDNAPFRVVLPNGSWRLDDSSAQNIGENVFLVASITNTNTQSKSIIVKTVLGRVESSSLDELSEGMRDSLANPNVKKLSDEPATFLGFKARRFACEINGTSYNEAIVFVAGNTGWAIMGSGLLDQKVEIKSLFNFYQRTNNQPAGL